MIGRMLPLTLPERNWSGHGGLHCRGNRGCRVALCIGIESAGCSLPHSQRSPPQPDTRATLGPPCPTRKTPTAAPTRWPCWVRPTARSTSASPTASSAGSPESLALGRSRKPTRSGSRNSPTACEHESAGHGRARRRARVPGLRRGLGHPDRWCFRHSLQTQPATYVAVVPCSRSSCRVAASTEDTKPLSSCSCRFTARTLAGDHRSLPLSRT